MGWTRGDARGERSGQVRDMRDDVVATGNPRHSIGVTMLGTRFDARRHVCSINGPVGCIILNYNFWEYDFFLFVEFDDLIYCWEYLFFL